jgi:hypothetical protein
MNADRSSDMDKRPLPYLAAALLCDRVLEGKDGSLTLVRIVDRVELQYPKGGLPEGVRPQLQISGLVSIKSGPLKGDFALTINLVRPTGDVSENTLSWPVKLLGEDQGQNLVLSMTLILKEEGLHWFDVFFEGELLTRIPLMVVRGQSETQTEKSLPKKA